MLSELASPHEVVFGFFSRFVFELSGAAGRLYVGCPWFFEDSCVVFVKVVVGARNDPDGVDGGCADFCDDDDVDDDDAGDDDDNDCIEASGVLFATTLE